MIEIQTWLPPILGVGVVQGILLIVVLLFFRRGNRKALMMLSIVVLAYTGVVFNSFIVFGEYYKFWPHVVLISYPLERLTGPSFYFFAVFLIEPSRRFKRYDILHLLPLLYLVYDLRFFYPTDTATKIGIIEYLWSLEHRMALQAVFMAIALNLLTAAYVVAAIVFLSKSIKKYKNITANTLMDYIEWVKKFALTFLIFLLVSNIGIVVSYTADLAASRIEVVTHLLITILIHYIAYITIGQPDRLFFKVSEISSKLMPTKKVTGESITALINLMHEKKPYLDPELKVHTFAAMLNMEPYQVSRIIKQEEGVNFYDFVNGYRVEAFKERALSNEYYNITLLGIALEVGFNSKSSFNRIFKKYEGVTPSEFLKAKKVPTSNLGTHKTG